MKHKKTLIITIVVALSILAGLATYKYYQVRKLSLQKDNQITSLQNQVNDLKKQDALQPNTDQSENEQSSCNSNSQVCIKEWNAKLNIPNAEKVTYQFDNSAGQTPDGRSYTSLAILMFKSGTVVAGCEDSIGLSILKLEDGSYSVYGGPALCTEDDTNGSTNAILNQIITKLGSGDVQALMQSY